MRKVKRGRNISDFRVFHRHPFAKEHLKKYTWICAKCGKEYISREDAELCYDLHDIDVPEFAERDVEVLRSQLLKSYLQTKKLLSEQK